MPLESPPLKNNTIRLTPSVLSLLMMAILAVFSVIKPVQADEQARELFSQYQDFIYQIRLFETSSSSKSSIGSGFQVADESLIVTNYHVIADAVYQPQRYRIELLRSDGVVETLKIRDVDVVHDLALLERAPLNNDLVQSTIQNQATKKQALDQSFPEQSTPEQNAAVIDNGSEATKTADDTEVVSGDSKQPTDEETKITPKTLVEKAANLMGKAVSGVKKQLSNASGSPQTDDNIITTDDLLDLSQSPTALLKQVPAESKVSLNGFSLAGKKPRQGDAVFSMGNPRDLGMTVVEGTYNGLLPHSFYSRILFTGSINPGMSGGPAINSQGELVGINVATSGNQLSFLVPVSYLQTLIERTKAPQLSIMKRIERQLEENQQQLMSKLLDADWPVATVGNANAIGEMTNFIRCWGGVEDSEQARYRMVYSRCFGDDQIYMARDFRTGMINYEFFWFEGRDLNALQFYNRYQQSFSGASPTNHAVKKHVGAFECNDSFVEISHDQTATHDRTAKDNTAHNKTTDEMKSTQWKSILCARPYKQFPGLYDVMLMAATVDQRHEGLIAHFSLSGIDKSLALAFTRRFMERVSWK